MSDDYLTRWLRESWRHRFWFCVEYVRLKMLCMLEKLKKESNHGSQ